VLYSYQYEIKKRKQENLELRKELELLKNPGFLEEKEYIRFHYIKIFPDLCGLWAFAKKAHVIVTKNIIKPT